MKKLGKLKLNNFSEMSEQEMKFVVGGQFDPSAKKSVRRVYIHVMECVLLNMELHMGHQR